MPSVSEDETEYTLYWILDTRKEYMGPYEHGFIGITRISLKECLWNHRTGVRSSDSTRPKKMNSILKVVPEEWVEIRALEKSCDYKYLSEVAFKYRPEPNIGWNTYTYGFSGKHPYPVMLTNPDGEKRYYRRIVDIVRDGYPLGNAYGVLNGRNKTFDGGRVVKFITMEEYENATACNN